MQLPELKGAGSCGDHIGQVTAAVQQHAVGGSGIPAGAAAAHCAGGTSHLEVRCWFDGTGGGDIGPGIVELHAAPIKTVSLFKKKCEISLRYG